MADLVSAKSIGGTRVCRETTLLLPKALPRATPGRFFKRSGFSVAGEVEETALLNLKTVIFSSEVAD